jgi:hypothetical protein
MKKQYYYNLSQEINDDSCDSGIRPSCISKLLNELPVVEGGLVLNLMVSCGGGNIEATEVIKALLNDWASFPNDDDLRIHYVGQCSSSARMFFSIVHCEHYVYPTCYSIVHAPSNLRDPSRGSRGVDDVWDLMAISSWKEELRLCDSALAGSADNWYLEQERTFYACEIYSQIATVNKINATSTVHTGGYLDDPGWDLRSDYSDELPRYPLPWEGNHSSGL